MDYKQAGVDVEAGREFVKKISENVASTYRREVLGGLGGLVVALKSLPVINNLS